jgi:hypothetical protein
MGNPEMLDKFLKAGASFDWITPLWAFIQDVRLGSPFQINIPYDTGWSGKQIASMLRSKGVRVWGLMVVDDTITFTVRRQQARYALYWLSQYELPLVGEEGDTTEGSISKSGGRGEVKGTLIEGWIESSFNKLDDFLAKL